MELRLRPLRVEDEPQARAAHAELEADSYEFLLFFDPSEPWSRYLEKMENIRRGRDLPPEFAPASFLIAEVGDALVGRVSIRYALSDYLLTAGGHIGYSVRPGYRGRGYATEILRQALVVARAEGVERVLVTCHEDNVPSITVIERHGGIFEDVRPDPNDGLRMRRYWIS